MKCTIKVKMDNAAFETPGLELARVLRNLADKAENLVSADQVKHYPWEETARDANGNRVAEMVVRK